MVRGVALAACVLLALAGPARAASVNGATMPDTWPVDGQNLVLNGMGVRTYTVLRVRGYAVGLYLQQRSSNPDAILASPGPKAVVLQFLHSASRSDIAEHYREGEAKNCARGECSNIDEAEFERLVAATPGAAVGDTLAYTVTKSGLHVTFNNRSLGDYSRELGIRIVASFIGATPPSPEVKRGLLGQP